MYVFTLWLFVMDESTLMLGRGWQLLDNVAIFLGCPEYFGVRNSFGCPEYFWMSGILLVVRNFLGVAEEGLKG